MKRREFLKGAAASAAFASSASATALISDNLMNDTSANISASHFGAIRGLNKNGKFEGIADVNELDFYPVTLREGVLARTYDETRIADLLLEKDTLKKDTKAIRAREVKMSGLK